MKVKEKTKLITFLTGDNIIGICLAPFGIYLKKKYLTDAKTIRHESIHWKQQMEMLIIFFYLWYLIEWIIRLITNFGDAYRNLSFEREAYGNESNVNYLSERKHYSWVKYLFKK